METPANCNCTLPKAKKCHYSWQHAMETLLSMVRSKLVALDGCVGSHSLDLDDAPPYHVVARRVKRVKEMKSLDETQQTRWSVLAARRPNNVWLQRLNEDVRV